MPTRRARPRLLCDALDALTSRPHLPIAAYLAVIGWATVLSGDRGAAGLLPTWLGVMWALAVAVGGTIATVACLTKATRVESGGLAFLAYGAAIYGACFTVATWPHWFESVAVSTAIVGMCLIRIRVLTKARRGTIRTARAMRRERRR